MRLTSISDMLLGFQFFFSSFMLLSGLILFIGFMVLDLHLKLTKWRFELNKKTRCYMFKPKFAKPRFFLESKTITFSRLAKRFPNWDYLRFINSWYLWISCRNKFPETYNLDVALPIWKTSQKKPPTKTNKHNNPELVLTDSPPHIEIAIHFIISNNFIRSFLVE